MGNLFAGLVSTCGFQATKRIPITIIYENYAKQRNTPLETVNKVECLNILFLAQKPHWTVAGEGQVQLATNNAIQATSFKNAIHLTSMFQSCRHNFIWYPCFGWGCSRYSADSLAVFFLVNFLFLSPPSVQRQPQLNLCKLYCYKIAVNTRLL